MATYGAVRRATPVASARAFVPGYLARRTPLELVVLNVVAASAAITAALPPSLRFELGSALALVAVIPAVVALTRAALLAAGAPGGLSLDQLDPATTPAAEPEIEEARHFTAAGLGLMALGLAAATPALVLL